MATLCIVRLCKHVCKEADVKRNYTTTHGLTHLNMISIGEWMNASASMPDASGYFSTDWKTAKKGKLCTHIQC